MSNRRRTRYERELIKVLCHVLEKEFRTAGDDPDQPYILKGSFTGEAARNIAGQTLTSLFQLGFGNNLGGLTDAMRDKKGKTFRTLNYL